RPEIAGALLTATDGISAATMLAARAVAAIMRDYSMLWLETVRALLIHSCCWIAAMHARCEEGPRRARIKDLLTTYGFGEPDLHRARRSAGHALTMVIEDKIQPYRLDEKGLKTNELRLHRLPWSDEALEALGKAEVRLRVTLFYFVEP